MSTPRTRLDAKAYLGAIGEILAEIFYPLVICVAATGLLFAVKVHPYVTLSVLTVLVASTVFFFGRKAAVDGRPWPRSIYLFATVAIAAVVGIVVVVVISLRGICGCF